MFNFGRLFVFEGADGSGKSAISSAFQRFLLGQGLTTHLVPFPGKDVTTVGGLVYKIQQDPKTCGIRSLTPLSLQALHIAAHLDTIETLILPALNRGQCVILDRYWWSTWAYGCADGVQRDSLEALVNAEKFVWGRWKPECMFYVTRSKPLRQEPFARWQLVKAAYEKLLLSEQQNYPIQILNNEGTLESMLDQVVSRTVALQS